VDTTQQLKDTENALRDFVSTALKSRHGDDWLETCGVTERQLSKWQKRREQERRSPFSCAPDERLLYYADFAELINLLEQNWEGAIREALGEWAVMKIWLLTLKSLRNPDAHRRELLPHQKQLVAGISGEIRNRLVRYRSKMDTAEDCFPRIESVRDNLGNMWTPDTPGAGFFAGCVLRPGDVLEYVITASDPLDEPLDYRVKKGWESMGEVGWQESNSFILRVEKSDIGEHFTVVAEVRSRRVYHASGDTDGTVDFHYTVLPRCHEVASDADCPCEDVLGKQSAKSD